MYAQVQFFSYKIFSLQLAKKSDPNKNSCHAEVDVMSANCIQIFTVQFSKKLEKSSMGRFEKSLMQLAAPSQTVSGTRTAATWIYKSGP